MIYNIYSILDEKTGFLTPTMETNDSVAIRNFEAAIMSRPDSLFVTHPKDYCLCNIGTFDTESGTIVGSPVRVIKEASVVVKG